MSKSHQARSGPDDSGKGSRLLRDVSVWILIAAVGAAVVILAVRQTDSPLAGAGGGENAPTSAAPSTASGSTPAQWYYDAANDRHWHNDHWDAGRPPANASIGAATGVASANQSPLPGGQAPTPWYHDAANNRHWHQGHGHWHDGAPPPLGSR